MWGRETYLRLEAELEASLNGGGPSRVEKQHKSGKMTARERIEVLFDAGTFHEVGALVRSRSSNDSGGRNAIPGDGVITGYGEINHRLTFVSSQDFTVMGGTLGEAHAKKICMIQDMALNARAPIIMINDGGGARIDEGVDSLAGYSGIFLRNTEASGVIPQIAVILGPCAGGACYSPAICDFIFMVENTSCMFITGPQVLKEVTRENVTKDALGGANVQASKSGVAHFIYPDDRTCLQNVRTLLSYLPQDNQAYPPVVKGSPRDRSSTIPDLVPETPKKAYDVRPVIETMVDKNSFFEIHSLWARNCVVGFGRVDGRTVGFVANQPAVMAGTLDCDASDKMARFVRLCDCFNIPLVTLVDTSGYLPGVVQEHNGIIRHGAKLLYAFSEATVPKITLIMRKAYGGAYIAMNSKLMGADMVFAWPIAEIAVMGAEGAVSILNHKEIEANPETRDSFIQDYKDKFLNPYVAAERGLVDEVIDPKDTRARIANALVMLENKQSAHQWRKHGNIPL